ncbi:MAG: flavin reductase family protein [Treponema sp.]|jgi:flavin reductase (DIM6/NTAB) family NADH-FMN oxidoreductase RutF|nr:flavin reductase family protein [Treponema sp.]
MEQKAVIPADSNWLEKSVRDFRGSVAGRIAEEWMLITAGSTAAGAGSWNTMTASWGALGELWGKDVAFMFIRPTRHTRAFADSSLLFTLSFFDKQHHPALAFCGEKSGRDYDKAAETGLTPIVFGGDIARGRASGAVAFKEASEIIICRKIYTHDFDPAQFLDPSIEKNYPHKDYHRMYIGEALALLTAQ